MHSGVTPNISLRNLVDLARLSNLMYLTSSSVSLALRGPSVVTVGTPLATPYVHVLPNSTLLMIVWVTPNNLANACCDIFRSFAIARISFTCSSVSLAVPLTTPYNLPFADACCMFCWHVHHSKLSALLLLGLLSTWFTKSPCPGSFGIYAVATNLCTENERSLLGTPVSGDFLRLMCWYPRLSHLVARIVPFVVRTVDPEVPHLTVTGNDRILPQFDTSYLPKKSLTGSHFSSSISKTFLSLRFSKVDKNRSYFCRARNSSTARRISSATATSRCVARVRSCSSMGAGR